MNIDFSPVFLNPDKSFRQPETIAESLLLVKDVSQSHGIKLAMTEWLRKKNIGTSALPQIRELHDYARELSGIGVGREIREEDFLILMERSDVKNLPGKYKHSKYRNYKKNLLKLLNNILLTDINNIDEEVVKDIQRSGLNLKMLIEIRDYINGFDFYFRGQMYDESMDKVEDTGKECKIFCIENHAGEMSFKEKKLIEAVNAVKLETRREGKYAVLTEMFKGENNAEFDPGEIEFFVSGSRLDEARKIKHFILKNIGEREYSYRDFTVVCSDDGFYRTLNNLLSASGVPVYSSYNQKDKNIETDVLRLINAGIGQDAATVLNFYNTYLTKEPINFELESITLSSLIEKLTKGKDSDLSLNVNAADKADEDRRKNSFFSFLRTADVKDSKLNVREAVREIEKYYINLNKSVEPEIKFEIYKYLPVLETVFGEEALLSEVVQYLYLILAKKDKKKLNTVRNGVRLSRMTEPAPAGKCLILSGLTEEGFLKDNGTIKILQKENYRKLYTSVYGISPDEALIENLGIFCSGPVEKAVMFIPNWGEEVIQSTYIDKVLESKTYEAEISIKSENPDFKFPEQKRKFSYRADDLIKRATGISDIDLFEGGRISRDRFFSVNCDRNAVLKKLSSASRIEQFMTCPAKFAQEMISSKDEIQDQFPFTAGNFYHDVSEVFLRFYRNKELLGHDEFTDIRRAFLKNQKNDLPYEFGKAEFTQARFTDFAKYYTKGVLVSKKAINAEREFSILKGKIAASGIDNKIKELNDIALENDPFCTYKNNKRTEEFIAFLARLILTIGPTPEEVTKTFLTELKFCDMEITEGIKVNTGYIDFMYIDHNRVPVVLDIKTTGKFKEYKDGIADYQIVQLLIYKEAVRRGIEKREGVNFDVDRSGRKPECDLLQQNYFDGLDPEKITAAYVSQNSPFTEFTFQVFGTFELKLQEKLGQDKGFLPQVNSACKYCGIGFTCPLNGQSDFERLEDYIPCGNIYYPDYKIITESKKSETKKFIMFSGRKKEAVVDKNVIISACAGAGKTEVLSSKYVHLLIKEPETGLENIVCITFTNKAAGEMKKRIYSKLNDAIDTGFFTAVEKGGDLSEYRISEKVIEKLKNVREEFYDKNLISTFHSFCNSMILKYGYSTKSLEDMDITPDVPSDNVSEEESISFIQLNYEDNFSSVLPGSFTDAQRSVFRNWLDSRSILYGGDNKGGFVHDIIGLYHEMKLSGEELVPDRWLKTNAEYEKYVNELSSTARFDEKTEEKINYDLTEDEWIIKYAVLHIISALDAHLLKFKKDKGLIELNDFHHTFIRMLDNDGDLKALLSSKFYH
ncbi:MAG TPA: UvrD-helicase domain-containing protein, partial [Clostridiales bacterium]|nr:UvrD-helicase domain-containing protein [Clostridiales bacterium]